MSPTLAAIGAACMLSLLTGCSVKSWSSGFAAGEGAPSTWPSAVPRRVAVGEFDGDAALSRRAAAALTKGLVERGFEVQRLGAGRGEVGSVSDSLAPDTAAVRAAGPPGVFVGSVTTVLKGTRATAAVEVRLMDAETGRVLWQSSAEDNAWWSSNLEPTDSMLRCVDAVLKALDRDLKRARKAP